VPWRTIDKFSLS